MRFLLQLASEKEELVKALASEMSDNSKLKVIQACLYLVEMEVLVLSLITFFSKWYQALHDWQLGDGLNKCVNGCNYPLDEYG